MIGQFKPKNRETWKSICIVDNSNEAFNYFINYKSSIIDHRHIADKDYYQVYKKTMSIREDTEAPIYQQIIELEAIQLHKLKTIIESKKGVCLDLKTDCIVCAFPKDIFPFELDGINLKDYYYDEAKTVPIYKLEDSDKRLQTPMMAGYKRSNKYSYDKLEWKITNDVDDNNFDPLIESVLKTNKSSNIDGPAGSGKSTMLKKLQNEMTNRGIKFISLAPTNKAARIINGMTIHKYVIGSSRKSMTDPDLQYVIIDEISMVPEKFYKFFIVMKRLKPDLKFIIAGDFEQLLPCL